MSKARASGLVKGARVQIIAPPHNSKRALEKNEVTDLTGKKGTIIREGSCTNGGWFGIKLDDKNKMVYYRRGALCKIGGVRSTNSSRSTASPSPPPSSARSSKAESRRFTFADEAILHPQHSTREEDDDASSGVNRSDNEFEHPLEESDCSSDAVMEDNDRETFGLKSSTSSVHKMPSSPSRVKALLSITVGSSSRTSPSSSISSFPSPHSMKSFGVSPPLPSELVLPQLMSQLIVPDDESTTDVEAQSPTSTASYGLSPNRKRMRKQIHPYRAVRADDLELPTGDQSRNASPPLLPSRATQSLLELIRDEIEPRVCGSCHCKESIQWHGEQTNPLRVVLCYKCFLNFSKFKRHCSCCNYVIRRRDLLSATDNKCPRCTFPIIAYRVSSAEADAQQQQQQQNLAVF